MRRRVRFRLYPLRGIRILLFLTCCLFIVVEYLSAKLIYWERIPSPTLSRLHPDEPITFDLQSYSVCSPEELKTDELISDYRQYANRRTCFLIEHLDGGPWWSYVTHEFAEILTYLKQLGRQSGVNYQSFSHPSDPNRNLTEHFLNACHFDEHSYSQNPMPIVVLLWDVNHFLWHRMSDQWNDLFRALQLRLLVFIDDLHYIKQESFFSRQYLFQNFASEIFSTYAYLFHNYYQNISSSKITWLPHAASSSTSRSINQSAENLLFISGANIFEWYPCRARGFVLCRTRKDLTACLEHPGYGNTMKNESSFFYGGERYFSYMKQYVFGLGTCKSVHYAIAKLFELPANGLALVTTEDMIPILERLHLYHNVHFRTVECGSLGRLEGEIIDLQKIAKEEIDTIRNKSQEIIFQRHMTQHRAQLLHVRLLAQALMATPSSSNQLQSKWKHWGRDC